VSGFNKLASTTERQAVDRSDNRLGVGFHASTTKPPLTIAAALMAIHRGTHASIDDGLAIEEAAFARIVATHDASEGISAFLEKRRPAFLG
jgi:enoyl-CoA hydratase/carnithine racemase